MSTVTSPSTISSTITTTQSSVSTQTSSSVNQTNDSTSARAREILRQLNRESSLELVGSEVLRSDAPAAQSMSDAGPAQEEECCKDCRDCCREVCTLENCCKCVMCLGYTVCCVIRCILGAREVERGRQSGDGLRVAVGVAAMSGNRTAGNIAFIDQII